MKTNTRVILLTMTISLLIWGVCVALAIVLSMYKILRSVDLDQASVLKE